MPVVRLLWVQVGDACQPLLATVGAVRSNLYSTFPLGLLPLVAVIVIWPSAMPIGPKLKLAVPAVEVASVAAADAETPVVLPARSRILTI